MPSPGLLVQWKG